MWSLKLTVLFLATFTDAQGHMTVTESLTREYFRRRYLFGPAKLRSESAMVDVACGQRDRRGQERAMRADGPKGFASIHTRPGFSHRIEAGPCLP